MRELTPVRPKIATSHERSAHVLPTPLVSVSAAAPILSSWQISVPLRSIAWLSCMLGDGQMARDRQRERRKGELEARDDIRKQQRQKEQQLEELFLVQRYECVSVCLPVHVLRAPGGGIENEKREERERGREKESQAAPSRPPSAARLSCAAAEESGTRRDVRCPHVNKASCQRD